MVNDLPLNIGESGLRQFTKYVLHVGHDGSRFRPVFSMNLQGISNPSFIVKLSLAGRSPLEIE